VGGSGDAGQHPYKEEVVRDHCIHFCEPNALETDAGDDLLVREGEEEFASDSCGGGAAELEDNDVGGEYEGYSGGYNE